MIDAKGKHLQSIYPFFFAFSFSSHAAEWSIESDIQSRIEYNDNIFLTPLPHNSVSGLVITPSVALVAKERNWETNLDTRLKSNNYSDSTLDSNDIYFDFTGEYSTERNVFSLNGKLDFDSSLNSESTDFGIANRRVKREQVSITPQYTRMLTERLALTIGYSGVNVDYVDANNTGFVPYETDTITGSTVYNVTEKDQFNFMLQGSAYESKDGSFEYDIVIARLGMNHQLSESFSVNYLVGSSRRDSTSRSTQSFTFFGQTITFNQVIDFEDSGFVLDAGFEKLWSASSLDVSFSRDNTTDSFGGLNEVDGLRLIFAQDISRVWRYTLTGIYENIESVDAASRFADRELLHFEPRINYMLDRDLILNVSYRYIRRKFVSLTSNQTPDSNRIFVGLTYNFPSISTF